MLCFGGVALCSVTIIRVWLKVLGKTFVMVKRFNKGNKASTARVRIRNQQP